jgi:hypothetical protein
MPITDDPNDPEYTSEHQYLLLLSLPGLRQLAPDLLKSLLKGKPQFTAAANRFPLGMEPVDLLEPAEGGVCQDCIAIEGNFDTSEDPPTPT